MKSLITAVLLALASLAEASTVVTVAGKVSPTVPGSFQSVDATSASFGANGSKSSFTYTGDLNMATNADITLSGASGNIVGVASITASAFFGSGAALTGVSGFGGAYATSISSGNSPTFTNTTWASVINSTITLTATGGRILAGWGCPMFNQVGNNSVHVALLVNGALIDGETTIEGFGGTVMGATAADVRYPTAFTHLTQTTYTGTTTLALNFRVGAQTGQLYNGASNVICQLWAMEMK